MIVAAASKVAAVLINARQYTAEVQIVLTELKQQFHFLTKKMILIIMSLMVSRFVEENCNISRNTGKYKCDLRRMSLALNLKKKYEQIYTFFFFVCYISLL